MRWFYFTLMLLSTWVASAQHVPSLTRQQMLDDFDTLTTKLKAISPHIPIKKALWKYDAFQEIAKLRGNIDTIHNDASFELLISQALNLCQDYHTGLMDRPVLLKEAYQKFNFYLPLAYVDGQYILTRSIIDAGRTVPVGASVRLINGQKPDTFVKSLTSELVLRYDLKRKKFYAENFWENQRTLQDGYIDVVFEMPDKKRLPVHFEINKKETFAHIIRDTIRNQVDYWVDQKVLYIKIFRMDNALIPFFRRKIAAFRTGSRPVDKIILDLRDNSGGNDVVWQSVYEVLLDRPISYPLVLDGPDPRALPQAYLKDREIFVDSARAEQASHLKKFALYQYTHQSSVLVPSDSSVRFKGKMVTIANENIYSAGASALVIPHLARGDRFYSVGRPTGRFLGVGYSPVVFQLPHSRIRYRIEPAIETTQTSNLADLMHDQFEFTVPITLEEIISRDRFDGNTLGAYYLIHFDPLIKKALAL